MYRVWGGFGRARTRLCRFRRVGDVTDHLPHRDIRIHCGQRAGEIAIGKGFHVQNRLVGLDLGNGLAFFYRVTHRLVPARQATGLHGVGQYRHGDFGFHRAAPFRAIICRAACTMSSARGILAASSVPLKGVGMSIPATRWMGASSR